MQIYFVESQQTVVHIIPAYARLVDAKWGRHALVGRRVTIRYDSLRISPGATAVELPLRHPDDLDVVGGTAQSARSPVQPPAQAAHAIAFSDFVFPPLMRALYTDEPDSVPDMQAVRGYYASIYAVFNKECSQDLNPNLAQAAMAYLSPEARAIQGNPFDVTPYIKMAEGGVQPRRLQEGEDDARTFLKNHKCQSREASTLRSNLQKLMFARRKVRVEPENNAKMIAMMNPAHRARLGIQLRPVIETPTEVIFGNCRKCLGRYIGSGSGPRGRPALLRMSGASACRRPARSCRARGSPQGLRVNLRETQGNEAGHDGSGDEPVHALSLARWPLPRDLRPTLATRKCIAVHKSLKPRVKASGGTDHAVVEVYVDRMGSITGVPDRIGSQPARCRRLRRERKTALHGAPPTTNLSASAWTTARPSGLAR